MISTLCLAAALALAPSAPTPEAVATGTRVRLTFEGDADPITPRPGSPRTRRAGTVVAVGDRTLTVAFDGHSRPVEFDKASVAGLERSLGGRKGTRKGAAIGFLAGVASGVLIGVASGDDPCDEEMDFLNFCNLAYSAGEKATIYGVGMGVVGLVGGAMVGASRSSERWEPGATVFASGRVGLHVVPAGRRGAGVAISLAF